MPSSDARLLAVASLLYPEFSDHLLRAYPAVADARARGDSRPVWALVAPRMVGFGDLVRRTEAWLAAPGSDWVRASAGPVPRPPTPRPAPRLDRIMAGRLAH